MKLVGQTWTISNFDYLMYFMGLKLLPILGLTLGLTGRTQMTFLYLDKIYMGLTLVCRRTNIDFGCMGLT